MISSIQNPSERNANARVAGIFIASAVLAPVSLIASAVAANAVQSSSQFSSSPLNAVVGVGLTLFAASLGVLLASTGKVRKIEKANVMDSLIAGAKVKRSLLRSNADALFASTQVLGSSLMAGGLGGMAVMLGNDLRQGKIHGGAPSLCAAIATTALVFSVSRFPLVMKALANSRSSAGQPSLEG